MPLVGGGYPINVATLLDIGANPRGRDNSGDTALDVLRRLPVFSHPPEGQCSTALLAVAAGLRDPDAS